MRKIFMLLLIIGLIAGLFISCVPTTPSGGDGEAVVEYAESITDQEGIGTFTVSDGQLSVEVLDADTEETIENIECFLSTDGTDAVILLVDPRGEYIPRLTSCQNEYPNKGMLWDGLKLFYMDLKIKFIEGGSHLVYLDEYLPEGLTREILDQQYEHTKTTEFKNLGGILRGSINAWIDFGIGFIETQVVTLVLTPISGVGGALYNIDSDVRTIDEAFESAMISKLTEKYENLGYEPDQYFEIWEAKWSSADFGLFLVLPCGPPKSSIPPTAYIDSIDPNPAQQGETVTFNGHGTDPDGEVWFYRWESDIDGVLSNLKSFNKSDLSVGIHIISFKVFDAAANPSDVVSESLNITPVTTNTYIIIASAGPHGSISPSGNVTVNQGSDKLFTITSDAGYQIADVLVDGSSIGAVSSYTFTKVTQDHTIYATFNIEINHAPVISSLTANPSSIETNQATSIICTASDPDGDTLTYTWTKTGGTFEGSTTGPSVTWRAPSTQGTYTVSCEVSDGEGGENSDSVNIVVTESDEEEIKNVIDSYCQALSDQDWDTARGYCVYDSAAYNGVTYIEGELEGWDVNFIVENINTITVTGEYAEASVNISVNKIYNGEIVETASSEVLLLLQKISNNWKLYRGLEFIFYTVQYD